MENGCEYFYKRVEYTWQSVVAALAQKVLRSILTTLTECKLLRYELSKSRIEKCYVQQQRNIDRACESRKTRREACVAQLAEMKNIYRVLIGNRQGKKSFAPIPEPSV